MREKGLASETDLTCCLPVSLEREAALVAHLVAHLRADARRALPLLPAADVHASQSWSWARGWPRTRRRPRFRPIPGAYLFGGSGSLFDRFNSLFGRLGNSLYDAAEIN